MVVLLILMVCGCTCICMYVDVCMCVMYVRVCVFYDTFIHGVLVQSNTYTFVYEFCLA